MEASSDSTSAGATDYFVQRRADTQRRRMIWLVDRPAHPLLDSTVRHDCCSSPFVFPDQVKKDQAQHGCTCPVQAQPSSGLEGVFLVILQDQALLRKSPSVSSVSF